MPNSLLRTAAALAVAGGLTAALAAMQDAPAVQRNVALVARKYAFEPARIEIGLNDLVKVTLTSRDIAHSFTVDAYRISKLIPAGKTVLVEFRADQAGTFPVYCNLRQDERCREMHAELVVRGR